MNHQKKRVSWLLSFLGNTLIQFLIGLFTIAFLTKIAESIRLISVKLTVKTLGYGSFFYLATPFVIYWLTYVSEAKLSKVKLIITILLVALYSYVFWDAYFSYQEMLGELLLSDFGI
ncbi:MAG TPA: hypothetical protein ACFCUY_12595 [Xenococcaceae cyanobacterium]|jgi:hypothetical protein